MTAVVGVEPTLRTSDGLRLRARVWDADPLLDGSVRHVAVVVAHGFTASADHHDVLMLCETLAAHGYDVVTYDARGHGTSEGSCTLGDAERHDVAAAVELARTRADRVVVLGASMGAIAVLRHAATDASLAGVVVLSCPARWRLPRSLTGLAAVALTRTGLGRRVAARHLGVRVARRWTKPSPPIALAAQVAARVAVVHGARDTFIRVGHARDLHGALGAHSRLTVVPGHGHSFGIGVLDALVDAVDWVLAA